MKGLSAKELEFVSWLEFYKKYFFEVKDTAQFAQTRVRRYNLIKNLVKKKRVVKLNKTKYYLVPVKAKSGGWTEHPFLIADETCNGEDYFIGGWAAAQYWRLTDQVPQQIDIFTTRRQGKKTVLNTVLVFHRTTKNATTKAVIREMQDHTFCIQPKGDSQKWMSFRR